MVGWVVVIRYSYIRLAVVGVWEFLTLFGKFPIPNSQFLIAGGIILTEEKATHCTNKGSRITNNGYTNNDKPGSQFLIPSSQIPIQQFNKKTIRRYALFL